MVSVLAAAGWASVITGFGAGCGVVGLSVGSSLAPCLVPSLGYEDPTDRPSLHDENTQPSHGFGHPGTGTDW
jgi:hypothetical protein